MTISNDIVLSNANIQALPLNDKLSVINRSAVKVNSTTSRLVTSLIAGESKSKQLNKDIRSLIHELDFNQGAHRAIFLNAVAAFKHEFDRLKKSVNESSGYNAQQKALSGFKGKELAVQKLKFEVTEKGLLSSYSVDTNTAYRSAKLAFHDVKKVSSYNLNWKENSLFLVINPEIDDDEKAKIAASEKANSDIKNAELEAAEKQAAADAALKEAERKAEKNDTVSSSEPIEGAETAPVKHEEALKPIDSKEALQAIVETKMDYVIKQWLELAGQLSESDRKVIIKKAARKVLSSLK